MNFRVWSQHSRPKVPNQMKGTTRDFDFVTMGQSDEATQQARRPTSTKQGTAGAPKIHVERIVERVCWFPSAAILTLNFASTGIVFEHHWSFLITFFVTNGMELDLNSLFPFCWLLSWQPDVFYLLEGRLQEEPSEHHTITTTTNTTLT